MATLIAFPPVLPVSLAGELEDAMVALTTFDVERLEAMELRIKTVTAAHLARCSEPLPELLEKHALLGRLLEVTAANLRVLVSVLQLEPRTERR
jgi:hypothetical protein